MKIFPCRILFLLVFLNVLIPGYSQVDFPWQSSYKYLKGKNATDVPSNWYLPGFNDLSWSTGNAPFRYGDGIGGVELSDMQTSYSTMYLRSSFTCVNALLITKLSFTVDYDDGFIIWVNGTEAFRRNAPANPAYNSFAPDNHESGIGEVIEVEASVIGLKEGSNLIAIQAFNVSLESTDFYFDLTISGEKGYPVYEPTSTIIFSHTSGFYQSAFNLSLSAPFTDAPIVYTLDGSNPQNSETAIFTSNPATILIDPNSTFMRPQTPAVVVRASLAPAGFKPSIPQGESYLFTDKVKTQGNPGGGWPTSNINGQIIDLPIDQRVFTDPQYSSLVNDAFRQIPSISIVTDLKNLFDPYSGIYVNAGGHGIDWERDCSVQLINPDGTPGFSVNAGLRIRGGWSRHPDFPKHAFRLFFREIYGNDKLRYPLFGDEGADEYDKIDLRCEQNYAWANGYSNNSMVRDVFSRDTQGEMGQQYTRSRAYHLYLNGMYWGIYQTQERSEARFAETYFGGDDEDYDVVKVNTEGWSYRIEPTDGNLDSWQNIYNMCLAGFGSNENYFKLEGKDSNGNPVRGAEVFIDIDNLIDYMMIIFYTGNFDSPTSSFGSNKGCNNFYAIDNRKDRSTGFTFYAHDSEHSLFSDAQSPGFGINEDRVNLGTRTDYLKMEVSSFNVFHPQWLHHKLTANAEYRVRFMDRAYRHLNEGGVFSQEKVLARINKRVSEIDLAVIAESARWGDAKRGTSSPYTRNDHWIPEINKIKTNFVPVRGNVLVSQLRIAKLYSSLKAPEVKSSGSAVINEVTSFSGTRNVSIENPNSNGIIVYTLDGSDPRLVGGNINPQAIQSGSTVNLTFTSTRQIRARIYNQGEWGPINMKSFMLEPENYASLKVTELYYHPSDWIAGSDTISGQDLEFIEFKNTGTGPMNISGLVLDSAVYHVFPGNTVLYPQKFYVAVSKPITFFNYYGLIPSGNFKGNFSNAGEEVLLSDPSGNEIIRFIYDDADPWPTAPDGNGPSLTASKVNPDGDPAHFSYWVSSVNKRGTPFADQFGVGIDEPSAAQNGDFTAFPVPATDFITFSLSGDHEIYDPELEIYDITGAMVFRGQVGNNELQTTARLGMSQGLYMVKYKAGSLNGIIKIMIIK